MKRVVRIEKNIKRVFTHTHTHTHRICMIFLQWMYWFRPWGSEECHTQRTALAVGVVPENEDL